MKHNYFLYARKVTGLLLGFWLLATTTWAQAPAWALATATAIPQASGLSNVADMAADASGNLLVLGNFKGQVTLGSTTLTSAGGNDFYIGKYLTATNTWAWVQRGGGLYDDFGFGLALSGSSVYITGSIINDTDNNGGVTLGSSTGLVRGSTRFLSQDLVVAKYTDTSTGATLNWTQVGGGSDYDQGNDIAVNGSSVYVVGYIANDRANSKGVVFGGNGTVAGTVVQAGASTRSYYDIVVAKYVDQGSSATLAWTQVGGGTDIDFGYGIAVSGAAVYITGTSSNDKFNSLGVLFGGTGTTLGTVPQYGASVSPSTDIVLAKYTDNGTSATVAWTQVGGGTNDDQAYSLAVSGSSVYLAGSVINSRSNLTNVLFGGSGTAPGTQAVYGATTTAGTDLVVAKYTDNGTSATVGWVQVGGGTANDYGFRILANGPNVYVAGSLFNNTANGNGALFGGAGTVAGTATQAGASATASADLLVAKYVDQGSSATLAWTQVGGGSLLDSGQALALTASSLYVGGVVTPVATFGSFSVPALAGSNTGFLGALGATMLAATPAAASRGLQLYPNPAPGAATLSGVAPNTTVLILDALGRRVATATADAIGSAALPAGLAPGLYLVRAGASTVRWAVE